MIKQKNLQDLMISWLGSVFIFEEEDKEFNNVAQVTGLGQ